MKLKILALTAVAAMALLAFASTASATTFEIKGVKQTGAVTIDMSLEKGTSFLETTTAGEFVNTCTESTIKITTTTPFTGTRIGGPVAVLTFAGCTQEPFVVHTAGYLTFENIAGTTNATVFWDSLKVTTPSVFGTLTCTTAATGTDIGTLTGKASGFATLDLSAVINCGFLLPSTKWEAKYEVTSPEGLGVTS